MLEPTVDAQLPAVMTDLPFGLMFGVAVVIAGLRAANRSWRRAIGFGVTRC